MDIIKHTFRSHCNETGALTFLEATRDIPFEIKRVYYVYNVEREARRGFHAHRNLEQYLLCVHGSCTILMDDGDEKQEIILSDPGEGLYVGPGVWHEMYNFSPGAVLLVLASDFYDESDYIREYDAFIDYKQKGANI